jgi:A/G-specific adenine glycosylase
LREGETFMLSSNDPNVYFSKRLLDWYMINRRDLPWRRSRNPYYIWVSEIMLQQTRVETVIPYYYRFIDKFPTIESLAYAPEEEVLKCWEGLGYYSRARNLQAAVREVNTVYGGVVPSGKDKITSLKGVGPYTAGAILSIAYNQPEPAVDGNVMRVLSRYYALHDDISKSSVRVKLEKLAQELIPEGSAGDFNQALMELGATVCTPKSPYCLTCPVMACCKAREQGLEQVLPIKTKAKPPRVEERVALIITNTKEYPGGFLIRQRPSTGLLAQMWELPHVEADRACLQNNGVDGLNKNIVNQWIEEGLEIQQLKPFMEIDHVFSHIHWKMKVYICEGRLISSALDATGSNKYRWIDKKEMDHYPFPNVFVRILEQYTP